MKITCPSCSTEIPSSQLNVETDVALCSRCNEAFSISALIATGQDSDAVDLSDPPRGAWFTETYRGWTIGATTRSPIAFFLVPFMCVWSGFSLGGIYGSQIVKGEFDPGVSLFGIPFVLGTLLFGSIAVMTVCGKITVTVDEGLGRLFAGVGPIGWARQFDWTEITAIAEEYASYRYKNGTCPMVIALVGSKRLRIGAMLSETRRVFLVQGLRKLLAMRGRGSD